MSLTPDPTRKIIDSRCSKCGRQLLINDSAIIYEGMREGNSLVLGSCCADEVIGSLIQDFSLALKNEIYVGHWVTHLNRTRLNRIIEASESIRGSYQRYVGLLVADRSID